MILTWELNAQQALGEIYSTLFDVSRETADKWYDEVERLMYIYLNDTITIVAIRPMAAPLGKI